MSATRRAVLTTLGAATAALAGCGSPSDSGERRLDVELSNYTSDPQVLKVQLLREGDHDHDDAAVYSRTLEVPSPSGDAPAGTLERTDVAENRAYVVRVLPKFGSGQWHHHHYYPGESTAEDGPYLDLRLYRDEVSDEVYVEFF